ncbi:polyprenol monophosphomannose synthase [Candidatus Dojkabacteria bacterium]|nr:polyprenol monophosphomannose synthase [Candidatus Dojkabacteria bacterium]
MKKLAICIPTYNEKENIERLVKAIEDVVVDIQISTTIIIIDDNSPDGTGKIADKLVERIKGNNFKIEVIHRKGKLGLASAYINAFKKAVSKNYDYILSMDADFSHKPEYIPEFIKLIEEYDLVIGSRNVKGGKVENWNLLRKFISKGGSLYSRIILGVNIKDFTGGFNMFRRQVLEDINLDSIKSEGYSFQIEMKYRTVKKGFKIIETPIIFPDREYGKAKMNKKIFFEAMIRVWQLRFSGTK